MRVLVAITPVSEIVELKTNHSFFESNTTVILKKKNSLDQGKNIHLNIKDELYLVLCGNTFEQNQSL